MIKFFKKTSSPRVFLLFSWHPKDSLTWLLAMYLIKQPGCNPNLLRGGHWQTHNTGGELGFWLPFVPYTIDVQWQRKMKR